MLKRKSIVAFSFIIYNKSMNDQFNFTNSLFSFTPDQVGWWINSILDIAVLAFFIYMIYRILIKTRATTLLRGLVILGGVYIIATILQLSTVLMIAKQWGFVIVIVIVIVFQPELRKIFTRLARSGFLKSSTSYSPGVDRIIDAAEILAENRRGALIVFERKVGLKDIADTGTLLNADISTNLLVTIFQHDTALHDGAVLVNNGKLSAAGCFLPLSEQSDIKKSFGTRHRAALGASESSDAVILIVSEESGAISLAYESNLYYDLSVHEIKRTLTEYLEDRNLDPEELDSEEGGFGN